MRLPKIGIGPIVAKIDTGAAKREAAAMNAKEAFDVLIVGGGLAGLRAALAVDPSLSVLVVT